MLEGPALKDSPALKNSRNDARSPIPLPVQTPRLTAIDRGTYQYELAPASLLDENSAKAPARPAPIAKPLQPLEPAEKKHGWFAATLSFCKGISDSLGLTDLAAGAAAALKAPYCLLTGDPKGALEAAKESVRVLTGVVKLVGEFTGASDLMRAASAAIHGNWKEAGLCLAMGAVSVAMLVATGGVGNIATMGLKAVIFSGLKTLAKEGFEKAAFKAGESIAEKAGQQIAEKLTQQVVRAAGTEAARTAMSAVEKQVLEKGVESVTAKVVEDISAKAVEKSSAELLRTAGLHKLVEQQTTELLQKVARNSAKDLAKEFEITEKAAKAMKLALGKPGAKGLCDDALKESITNGFTEALHPTVEKKLLGLGFKESFNEGVATEIKAVNKRLAENGARELDETMVKKSAEKGFDRGLRDGLRKVVREGVDEAFDKFRKSNRSSDGAQAAELNTKRTANAADQNNAAYAASANDPSAAQTHGARRREDGTWEGN